MFKSFLLAIILTAAATSLANAITCADGENQMSVEGVEGIFCVAGDPCIAIFSSGACPAAQEGLPYGSYCGVVASGVYGCKTYTSAATEVPTPEVTTEAPTSEPTTVAPTPTVPVPITPYSNCTTESTEVSVQGLKGAFCVNEPVCVKQVSTGKCPAPQDGLQFGSFCDLLPTGVYGCRPYTADNVPTTVTYEAPLDCSNNPAGDTPVSIVSANQDFCAPEPVCSGVYGCVFMAST
ncbi:hypothetical protein PC129_g15955 [Phytophthora cactorum]|uniref:Uncharacterized protein n=1 Tax=Phytophthora cactorum TaxID=29920 RepID=A0A8T1HPE1_9STRA|nr:hypothetical protein Pcac1_g19577 [Phytophthora cactorum]KAG2801052.1 hypothetical protein PC112_g20205 [Phytophthora cactorum]KAG2801623.1 hypothetical protein PC111_g19468 [Phytophthora cactorum]KAG2836220.1 hypothetical protein PC113_g20074 [Phytophthora cactorum]KAG2876255.1 hypothetical protein PC114_g24287 [Phytophthora cactorum]